MKTTGKETTGEMKAWWIPQIPGEPFEVPVTTLIEAKLLLEALANYDLFQLAHRIKPDYCNMGGLVIWDGTDWTDWHSDEGRDIYEYELQELRVRAAENSTPQWEEAA